VLRFIISLCHQPMVFYLNRAFEQLAHLQGYRCFKSVIPKIHVSKYIARVVCLLWQLPLETGCSSKLHIRPRTAFLDYYLFFWTSSFHRQLSHGIIPSMELLYCYASINSSCYHPPPGIPQGFVRTCVPGAGILYNNVLPRGWGAKITWPSV